MSYLSTHFPSLILKSSLSLRKSSNFDALNSGFTNLELIALQKAWSTIEPRLRQLSTEILTDLFSEHYEIMDKIRDDDGKLCNFEVINHIYWLLLLYGTIIKHNLTPMKTRKVVEPLTVQMGKYAMDLNSINIQLDCIKKHLLAKLAFALSPTTVAAFDRLNKNIIKHIFFKIKYYAK
uniref:Uncharacterized protein n=1 Tax=Ceratitis capitata TaxID=7213 RepID=W8BDD0_CERCA